MARGDTDENGNPIDPTDPTNPNRDATPPGGITRQQVIDWYQKYNGRAPESEDIIQRWMANPQGAAAVEDAIKNSPEAQAYAKKQAAPPPTGPTPPPGGGNPGAPGAGSSIFDPFSEPFTAPTKSPYPGAPTFTPPDFPTIPKWQAPTAADAANSPGYQFRVQQGDAGLQNWAAARGTLNSSDTANALIDYNQNAASQEYQNVWNRQFQGYNSDVQTQYLDPYAAKFSGWQTGTVQPGLAEWQTQMAATQHDNDINYSNAYNKWLSDFSIFDAQRKFTNDTKFRWATA